MGTGLQIHQRGFTLLELLSTLAILSIILVMAIPAYKDYETRGKILGGIARVGDVLLRVEETYIVTGVWPDANSVAGVDEPEAFATTWVNEIVVEHDADDETQIRVVYNNDAIRGIGFDDDIIFKPTAGVGSIKWDCSGGTIASYYRPARCQPSDPSNVDKKQNSGSKNKGRSFAAAKGKKLGKKSN